MMLNPLIRLNKFTHRPARIKQSGATLIEALISMLIFSIGLLGIAGLVVSSMAQQKIAQSRSEGAVFAADIAENMRANVAGLTANRYLSAGGTPLTPITTYAAAKAASDAINSLMKECDKTATTPCSATTMANNDYNNWLFSIRQSLPSGTGLIQVGQEPTARIITVVWDAKASSNIDQKFELADNANNCPASLGLTLTQKKTFRCVTTTFIP